MFRFLVKMLVLGVAATAAFAERTQWFRAALCDACFTAFSKMPDSFQEVVQQLWHGLQESSLPLREAIQAHWESFSGVAQEAVGKLWERICLSSAPALKVMEEALIQLQPYVEQAQEALKQLYERLQESSLPLREELVLRFEQLQGSTEVRLMQAAGIAAVVVVVIVLKLLLQRFRRAPLEAAAQKQAPVVKAAKVPPAVVKVSAQPAAVIKGTPKMTLTEAAQVLSDAGIKGSAAFRQPRTSSPRPSMGNIQKVDLSEVQQASLLKALNENSYEELLELDGCGPASAERILRFRKQGHFGDMSDMDKSGIPKNIVKRIANGFVH